MNINKKREHIEKDQELKTQHFAVTGAEASIHQRVMRLRHHFHSGPIHEYPRPAAQQIKPETIFGDSKGSYLHISAGLHALLHP